MRPIAVTLNGEELLKRLQRLDGALKADCSWLDAVVGRRLSDYGADEIVSQDVSPNFFPNEFRRFAAQDVHLQRPFDRS